MTPDGANREAPVALDEALDAEDGEQLVLSELINRVLDKGIVISGHVTISVAEIDLIALDLRVLISSIEAAIKRGGDPSAHG